MAFSIAVRDAPPRLTAGGTGRNEVLMKAVLEDFHGTENFEERELPGLRLDPGVLRWLRGRVRVERHRP